MNYLAFIVQVESKFKNSVLRTALAQSLQELLLETHAAQLIPRIADDQDRAQVIGHLHKIYELTKKWYKKPKTRLAAFKLGIFMYLHFDAQKMDLCKKDVVKLITEQLHDKAYRQEGIEAFSSFLRILPNHFAKATNPSSKVWKALVAEIMPALFLKKSKDVSAVEIKELTGVLSEMLRLDETLLSDTTLVNVLKQAGDYSIEIRCVVMRVFGAAVATSTDPAQVLNVLQPVTTPILLQFAGGSNANSSAADLQLLSSVLVCFPHLCIPEKRRSVAASLIPWAFSSNPELWTVALQSLQAFVLQDVDQHLPFVLTESFTFLKQRATSPTEDALVHVRNVSLLLTTFLNSRKAEQRSVSLATEQWNAVRAALQTLSLCWVLHGDRSVREEACRLLDLQLQLHQLSGFESTQLCTVVNSSVWTSSGGSSLKKEEWSVVVSDILLQNDRAFVALVSSCWKLMREALRLEDHVVFFCKTLHLVLGSDDTDVAADVLSNIVSCLSSGDEPFELRIAVCDALQLIHESCTESVVRISVTEAGKKKQGRGGVVGGTLRRGNKPMTAVAVEILMLRPYEIMMRKAAVATYPANTALKQFFRDRMLFWTSGQVDFATLLDISSRFFLVDSIGRFFVLEGASGDGELHEALMTLVEQLAFSAHPSSSTGGIESGGAQAAPVADPASFQRPFRTAVVACIRDYFQWSPISIEKLHQQWLPFLFRCSREWGVVVEDGVVDALSFALNRFPTMVQAFALDSVRPEGALMFLGAARTFVRSTAAWISRIGVEKILQLCLLQLCSPVASVRQVSMDLANALGREDYSPGYLLAFMPNLAYNMYVELALDYSRALASRIPRISAGVVQEFVGLYAHLSDQFKSLALQLMEPWCRNFCDVAQNSRAGATVVLEGLLTVTGLSDRVYHREHVQQLWRALFHTFSGVHMQFAVEFLVSSFPERSEDCLLSLASLARTENGASVIAVLASCLRSYPDVPSASATDIPYVTRDRHAQLALDPQYRDILEDVLARETADVDLKASSAFQMLSYLSFEKASLMWPFLPAILHNAVAFYHSKSADFRVQSQTLLGNMAQSLLRQMNISAEQRALVTQLQGTLFASLDHISQDQTTREELAGIVKVFSLACADLPVKWSAIALAWGLGCNEPGPALVSLRIYGLLQTRALTLESCGQFATCLFVSLFHGWFHKTESLIRILRSDLMPLGQPADMKGKKMLVSLATSLLLSCSHAQVLSAAGMLKDLTAPEGMGGMKGFPTIFRGVVQSEGMYRASLTRPLFADATKDLGIWLIRFIVSNLAPETVANDFATELVLIVSAICAQLAEVQREDVYNWLVAEQTPVYFRDFVELFSRHNFHMKPVTRQRFVSDWAALLLSKFSPQLFSAALDVLVVLLRNGVESWKPPCYRLLNGLMEAMPTSLTQQQFRLLAEMATFHCYSNNPDVRSAAERTLLDLIVQYQHDVVSQQVLSLVRVIPSPQALEADRITALFPGDYGADFVVMLRNSAQAVLSSCLGAPKESAAANAVRERFREPSKLSFRGFTDNAARSAVRMRTVSIAEEPMRPKKAAPHIMAEEPSAAASSASSSATSTPAASHRTPAHSMDKEAGVVETRANDVKKAALKSKSTASMLRASGPSNNSAASVAAIAAASVDAAIPIPSSASSSFSAANNTMGGNFLKELTQVTEMLSNPAPNGPGTK
jgi:hypothetical protein